MLRTVSAVLFFVLSIAACGAQINYVTGAPFSERVVGTSDVNGKQGTQPVRIARSSDGNVYQAFYVSATASCPYRIGIDDVVNNRSIFIDPRSRTYFFGPMPPHEVLTLQQEMAYLEKQQKDYGPQGPSSTGPVKMTALGTRQMMGYTAYGVGTVSKGNSSLASAEVWLTDFGATLLQTTTVTGHGSLFEQNAMTGLQRGEPDAALFAIPQGYREVNANEQVSQPMVQGWCKE